MKPHCANSRNQSVLRHHGARPGLIRRFRRARFLLVPIVALSCAACSVDVPKDPAHTLSEIKESGVINVGIVSGPENLDAASFFRQLESKTGAKSNPHNGQAEELLYDLEHGDLALVIGSFAKSSPWKRKVWLSPPINGGVPTDDEPVVRAAARMGENKWIILIENTLRQQ